MLVRPSFVPAAGMQLVQNEPTCANSGEAVKAATAAAGGAQIFNLRGRGIHPVENLRGIAAQIAAPRAVTNLRSNLHARISGFDRRRRSRRRPTPPHGKREAHVFRQLPSADAVPASVSTMEDELEMLKFNPAVGAETATNINAKPSISAEEWIDAGHGECSPPDRAGADLANACGT